MVAVSQHSLPPLFSFLHCSLFLSLSLVLLRDICEALKSKDITDLDFHPFSMKSSGCVSDILG